MTAIEEEKGEAQDSNSEKELPALAVAPKIISANTSQLTLDSKKEADDMKFKIKMVEVNESNKRKGRAPELKPA